MQKRRRSSGGDDKPLESNWSMIFSKNVRDIYNFLFSVPPPPFLPSIIQNEGLCFSAIVVCFVDGMGSGREREEEEEERKSGRAEGEKKFWVLLFS